MDVTTTFEKVFNRPRSFKWPDTSVKANMISEMRFAFSTIKKLKRQCGFLIESFDYDSIKKEVSLTFVNGYKYAIQGIDLVFLPITGTVMSIITEKDDLCLVEVTFKES